MLHKPSKETNIDLGFWTQLKMWE